MTKIMFVCHGNICRSPMAEFIFKDLIARRGVADQYVIASSATSTEEVWNGIGNPVYPPAKAELAKHGLPPQRTSVKDYHRTTCEQSKYLAK